MKAAVANGYRTITIEDRPVPRPARGQVLVRVRAVGICGSDIKGFSERDSRAREKGLIIGHEAAGEIAALGEEASRFAVGARVALDPQVVCGECYACRAGWTSVCERKKVIGSSLRGFLDGAMAEYVAVDERMAYAIPDSLGFDEAATVEPVANALHAVARGKVRLGDSVLVVGAGTLGLCIIQAALIAGARTVIAVGSTSEKRLAAARVLGATHTGKAADENLIERIRELTEGKGADVAIDAAGNEKSLELVLTAARKRGRVVAFGNASARVNVNLLSIINKELETFGSSGANEESELAIECLAAGRIDVAPIITHRMEIEKTQEAFELLTSPNGDAIKAIIRP